MKELYIKNNEYINKINKLNKELNETNLRYKDILNIGGWLNKVIEKKK